MLAELPAVVAPKDDDGVVGKAEPVERIEELADLRVGVADAGIVAMDELAGGLAIHGTGGGNPGIGAELAGGVDSTVGCVLGRVVVVGDVDLVEVVEIPVFLRSIERQVRFEKADGEEERLVGRFRKSLEIVRSMLRGDAVRIRIVRDVGGFPGHAAVLALLRPEFLVLGDVTLFRFLVVVAGHGRTPWSLTPAVFVVARIVQDLPEADGGVAVLLEVRVQRQNARRVLFCDGEVGDEPLRRRADAREKRGP